MEENKSFSKGIIALFVGILALGGVFVFQQSRFSDNRLKVIFCDVGQGDATFIRTPKGLDILIDGGPNEKVLDCLSKHQPFWDRTIEIMMLTHPHADHFVGLIDVLKRYTVLSFVAEKVENKSQGFKSLQKYVEQERIKSQYVYAGDRFTTKDGVKITVLGPSESFIEETSPQGMIGENKEFGSLILLISYGEFDLLITGDSQKRELTKALASQGRTLQSIEVLQVPHHGSKTGLDEEIVDQIHPEVAVISVGKKNRYGHPHKEIEKILRDGNIKTLRTDKDGDVQILSDGKEFSIGK